MTSAIGGVGVGSWAIQRPDTSSMVKNLFAKVDTKNQGYIDKAELQSAFDQISTDAASGSSNASSSVDAIFKQLDGDSDGKISKQEMTTGMQKLADQFDSQFNQSRTSGMNNASQGGDNNGFSKDQLTSMSKEIGSSDSKRSALMSKIADNFDKADTNNDGKVNRAEAMSFDKASKTASASSDASASAVEGSPGTGAAHGAPPSPPSAAGDSSASSANKVYAAADTNQDGKVSLQELLASLQTDSSTESGSGTASSKTDDSNAAVMKMVMQLMQAYGAFGQDSVQTATGDGITVAA